MRSSQSSPECLVSVADSRFEHVSGGSLDQARMPAAPREDSAFSRKMALIAGIFSALGLGACHGFETDSAMGRGLGFKKNDSLPEAYKSFHESSNKVALNQAPAASQNPGGFLIPHDSGLSSQRDFRADTSNQPSNLFEWQQFAGGLRSSADTRYQASWDGSNTDLNMFEQIYDRASNRVEDFIDLVTSGERATEWGVKRLVGHAIGRARDNYLQELEEERRHGFGYSTELYDPLWGLPAITNRTRYRLSLPSINDIRRHSLNIGIGFETPLSDQTAVSVRGEWAEGGEMQLALVCQTVF